MKTRAFIAASLLAAVNASGAFAAVLDANHTTTDNPDNNTGLGIVTTSLAQTFTVLGNGTLSSVSFSILNLFGPSGYATEDVTFDIRNVSGGLPDSNSGTALFSTSIANSDIGVFGTSPYSWSTIDVDVSSANIAVSSGDMFAFVLSSAIGQEFGVQTDFNNAYAGGQRASQNGDGNPFGALSTADLTFATYIEPSAVPLPAGLPLLLAGLGGLGLAARRRSHA